MSLLLNKELAQAAVDAVMPAISALMHDRHSPLKRKTACILVANPSVIPTSPEMRDEWVEAGGILHRHDIGDNWEYPFDKIATSKLHLSMLYRMSTREIQFNQPWLTENGDTSYYGSVYCDGLAVACSGVQPYFDEMISEWVLSSIRGYCFHAVDTQPDSFVDKNGFFQE